MSRETYTTDDLFLDVEAATLTRAGERLELPQLSFDLLVALVRQAPDVLSADELVATVWKGLAVSTEALTQRVALLRRSLGDPAQNPRYVRAVRSRGYQWVPPVHCTGGNKAASSAASEVAASEVQPAPAAARPRHRQVAGLALAALVALFFWAFRQAFAPSPPASFQAVSPSTKPAGARELLTRAGEYLARHQEADNEHAIELYRRALELAPHEPDALAGLSLALAQRSTKFNRPFDPESEALARQALAISPRSGIALHALGLALDSQGRLQPALVAYLEAAQLENAPAPVLASAAHLLQVSGRLSQALETNLRAAGAAGPEPIYLEVQIGTTLALLGFPNAANVWFERGLTLKPDNVFAAAAYAQFQLAQGRILEADAIARAAIERGILRPELHRLRSLVAFAAGRRDETRRELDRALALDPKNPSTLVRQLWLDRDGGGAISGLELERRYRELSRQIGEELARGDSWPGVALDLVVLETGFGRPEAALAALDRALELGFRDEAFLRVDPMLESLRREAGFAERLERLRLAVEVERQGVLGAPWLPAGFVAADVPVASGAAGKAASK